MAGCMDSQTEICRMSVRFSKVVPQIHRFSLARTASWTTQARLDIVRKGWFLLWC